MLIIQQGDQYSIQFQIKQNDVVLTPSNVTDVRIQIDKTLKSYVNNQITFDTPSNKWIYPLTEKESVALDGATVPLQIGIKQSGSIYYSPTMSVVVGKSIIKKEW